MPSRGNAIYVPCLWDGRGLHSCPGGNTCCDRRCRCRVASSSCARGKHVTQGHMSNARNVSSCAGGLQPVPCVGASPASRRAVRTTANSPRSTGRSAVGRLCLRKQRSTEGRVDAARHAWRSVRRSKVQSQLFQSDTKHLFVPRLESLKDRICSLIQRTGRNERLVVDLGHFKDNGQFVIPHRARSRTTRSQMAVFCAAAAWHIFTPPLTHYRRSPYSLIATATAASSQLSNADSISSSFI